MKKFFKCIRQLFCKHDMEYFNDYTLYYWDEQEQLPLNYEAMWRCKKCGYIIMKEC